MSPTGSKGTSLASREEVLCHAHGHRAKRCMTRLLWVLVLAVALGFETVRLCLDYLGPVKVSRSAKAIKLPDFSHLATHCADVSPIAADSFVERQDALARTLHALGAAAYVAEPGANAGFFANLTGSLWHLSERPLLLVIQPQTDGLGSIHANVSILTPTFEKTRAMLLPLPSASSVTYTAWPEDSDPYAQALALIPNLEEAIIYVDGGIRMFIADSLQKAAPQAHVTIAPAELRQLRERKSAEELEIMKYVNEGRRDHMYIGMRESEAMSLVVSALSTAGLKDTSALTLFGENAALPHGSGTDRVLGKTDFILIDTGGVLHGYESDVTRTFALPQSEISAEKLKLWNIVHMAQARALETAKNGTVTAEVDREARKVISDAGYGKYFTHRLGHGIGMEVHESPYLRGGTEDVILTGNSFSDEPGIYIEGEVGVRLEDCFYIDDDGVAQYLTQGVGGAASGPWTP